MKTRIIVGFLFLVLVVYVGSALAAGTEDGTNSYFGDGAGTDNTGGYQNTFIGFFSGNSNSTGFNNTYLGTTAGQNSNGSGNVFLGFNAGANEPTSNNLYIANSGTSSPLIYGQFDTFMVEINGDFYVTGDTYMTSDKKFKKEINSIDSSLEKIMNLRGVSFKWNGLTGNEMDLSKRTHYGVVAQEVQKTLPDIVMKDRNGDMNVAYMELIPVLIEAVKEQQQIISEMAEKIQNIENDLKLKNNLAMAETHVR